MLREVYESALVVNSGRYHTTVNEFTDQLPALRPSLLKYVAEQVVGIAELPADKVLVEEEKGAVLGAAVSLLTGIPLAVARPYSYTIASPCVALESEYLHGVLRVNGIERGDNVLIVDDTISTGGTLIALLRAIQTLGAHVKDVVAVVEKVDNGGVKRVLGETGIRVKTCLQIQIQNERVVVL